MIDLEPMMQSDESATNKVVVNTPLLVKFRSVLSDKGIPRAMLKEVAAILGQHESWVIYAAVARMHKDVLPEQHESGTYQLPNEFLKLRRVVRRPSKPKAKPRAASRKADVVSDQAVQVA